MQLIRNILAILQLGLVPSQTHCTEDLTSTLVGYLETVVCKLQTKHTFGNVRKLNVTS